VAPMYNIEKRGLNMASFWIGWLICAAFNLTCLVFYKPPKEFETMINAAGGLDRMIKIMAVIDIILAPLVTASILFNIIFPQEEK
jgi:hypothetical protein